MIGEILERYEQLWGDRERFYNVLEILPQTFSHFDSQRRNLLIFEKSMSHLVDPREVSAEQAGLQTFL
jgi:hypothetical protein